MLNYNRVRLTDGYCYQIANLTYKVRFLLNSLFIIKTNQKLTRIIPYYIYTIKYNTIYKK